MGENILVEAIHREIDARDLYRSLSERIGDSGAKQRMLALSAEEEEHREILAARYEKVHGKSFDRNTTPRPDDPALEFVRRSTFRHTDALEVLRLAIGAETDAAALYANAAHIANEREEARMYRSLVKFEKAHKKKIERELRQATQGNAWQVQ